MEKKISYLDRTFDDYKKSLISLSEKYYPDLSTSFNDASVAAWMIDLLSSVADNESYHIDRVYQETNIDSAKEMSSLMSIARNNGIKVPGPKGAMAEVKISCVLPVGSSINGEPDWTYAPIIKRGTRFAASSQQFELLSDVDFAEQFDENGNSNRTYIPRVNTNGQTTGYTVSKTAVVTAGETRVYRVELKESDIEPFMEVLLPIEGVMSVESILSVDSNDTSISPSYGEFYGDGCEGKSTRFYEVDSLSQGYAWSDSTAESVETNSGYSVVKGEWKPIDHKFITEYTDKGYLKIIFGAGNGENAEIGEDAEAFSKWQMSKMLNNGNLGVLPDARPLYILYRLGGGKVSNVAQGAISRVSYLNAEFRNNSYSLISPTISVENTTPSVSGKDMPSEKELKNYIKYHSAAQNRCVTIKDYIDRVLQLPPRYGTPFRVGAAEENNKVALYVLGLDNEGHLSTLLPITLIENMEEYLSEYRCINDYVEIKPGRIVNVRAEVEAMIDKNYNKNDVMTDIFNTIVDYFDISKHIMGEEIYVGDVEKEISKVDGVINLISLKIRNITGGNYSLTECSQEMDSNGYIDLEASEGILYNDGDTMMEIKYPDSDIKIKIKER